MKILLDENLPHQLRFELPGHEVYTTTYMGWSGVQNGQLLLRAASQSFEVLITNDQSISYQQNNVKLPLAIVVLHIPANAIEHIRPKLPELLMLLAHSLEPGVYAL